MKIISRKARPYSITLYNYISTANGIAAYQRTVLERVFLDTAYKQRLAKAGISTEDQAELIMDLRDCTATDGRTFLPAKEWKALSVKTGHFTFNVNDFFVEGYVSETLPASTKADMMAKYRCFSVTSVAAPACGSGDPVIVEVLGK